MLKNISLLNSSRNYYPKYSSIKKLQPNSNSSNKNTLFKNNTNKPVSQTNDEILVTRKKSGNKKWRSPKKRSKKRSPKVDINLGKDMVKEKINSRKRSQQSRVSNTSQKPNISNIKPKHVLKNLQKTAHSHKSSQRRRSPNLKPSPTKKVHSHKSSQRRRSPNLKPSPTKKVHSHKSKAPKLKKIAFKIPDLQKKKEILTVKIRTNPEIFNNFIYEKDFDVNHAKSLLITYGLIKNENVPDELVAYLYQICKDNNVKMKLYIP